MMLQLKVASNSFEIIADQIKRPRRGRSHRGRQPLEACFRKG
jgi:hypothetical protein